jgi:hypothetical protein
MRNLNEYLVNNRKLKVSFGDVTMTQNLTPKDVSDRDNAEIKVTGKENIEAE